MGCTINGANMHAQCTPARIKTTSLEDAKRAMDRAISNVPKAQPVKVQPVEVPIHVTNWPVKVSKP